jgi:hypothetical protein
LKGPIHIPRRRQRARGFVARVDDPRLALDKLQRWTLVRPLTLDDLAEVQPEPAERRRARTRRTRTNIALFVIVAVQAIPPFFIDGN